MRRRVLSVLEGEAGVLFDLSLDNLEERGAQEQDAYDVGERHEGVGNIGKEPDQVEGKHGPERAGKGVDAAEGLLGAVAEEIDHAALTVDAPAEDRGKGEKRKADGHTVFSHRGEIE